MTSFQASVKRQMVHSAEKVILLADERKFGINGILGFANFSEIDCIITSAPIANEEILHLLEESHVELIVAHQ